MSQTPRVAISVENLSKRYRLGGRGRRQRPDSLRDTIWETGVRLGRRLRGSTAPPASADGRGSYIWALHGVSFEVAAGEVLGIVGPNGAGKSTLLKVLSRITEPTEGRVQIAGRVGSLLEVGTGFHPDLTGRENVYLSGAILGMRKAEIDRKLDEIVEFAEVSRFVDTAVKHYSSGMYLRLAFAVGAHLETDVMLVDEVLAVGDARFQEKCLSKMRDVGQHGRTVLFVSHNLLAITRLCERAILVDGGKIWKDGPSHDVVSAYLNAGRDTTAVREWPDVTKAPGRGVVRLRAVRLRTCDDRPADTVDIRQPIGMEMEYDVLEGGHILLPNFGVYNDQGTHLFSTHDLDPQWRQRRRPAGRYVSTTWIPGNLLSDGMIFVGAGMETVSPKLHQFWVSEAVAFRVMDTLDGDSARGDYTGKITGLVRPRLTWLTEFKPFDAPQP
jgi:lipopolysaccharide transport system ATP-binding protein